MISTSATGKVFQTLENFLFVYGKYVFEKTAGVFLGLFLIIYGCLFIFKIMNVTLFNKKVEFEEWVKPFLICSFLTSILGTSLYTEEWIVRPVYNLAVWFTTILASQQPGYDPQYGITGMLDLIDGRLDEVIFSHLKDIMDSIGFSFRIDIWVGIFIMFGAYIFVWMLFLALLTTALFRFLTFFAISPLVYISMFTPKMKPIATAGFKSLLHGFLSMFMMGIAMGATIVILASEQVNFMTAGTINKDWIFSESYFTLLLVAMVSIAFHLLSARVSANLAGIDDGPGIAGAVAGVGTAAIMAGKGFALSMGSRAASLGGQGAAKGAMGLKGLTSMGSNKNLYSRMTGK